MTDTKCKAFNSGPAELGVQLHTYFLAPSISGDQVLSQLIYLHTKLYTQTIVGSAGSEFNIQNMQCFLLDRAP